MSPHPGRSGALQRRVVDELLRELGPRLRRGGLPEEGRGRLPTGIAPIDALLGGGFPRGRLSEVAGAASSGRTSLALALLARATRAGEVCALVDATDGFDPRAAEAAGIVLPRVLWARAPGPDAALRGAGCLLEARGFALVVVDLPADVRVGRSLARLAQGVAGTDTALLALAPARVAGTAAEVALEMRTAAAHFGGAGGAPALLEALEVEAHLVRHRTAPADRSTRVRLRTPGIP